MMTHDMDRKFILLLFIILIHANNLVGRPCAKPDHGQQEEPHDAYEEHEATMWTICKGYNLSVNKGLLLLKAMKNKLVRVIGWWVWWIRRKWRNGWCISCDKTPKLFN